LAFDTTSNPWLTGTSSPWIFTLFDPDVMTSSTVGSSPVTAVTGRKTIPPNVSIWIMHIWKPFGISHFGNSVASTVVLSGLSLAGFISSQSEHGFNVPESGPLPVFVIVNVIVFGSDLWVTKPKFSIDVESSAFAWRTYETVIVFSIFSPDDGFVAVTFKSFLPSPSVTGMENFPVSEAIVCLPPMVTLAPLPV